MADLSVAPAGASTPDGNNRRAPARRPRRAAPPGPAAETAPPAEPSGDTPTERHVDLLA
jgi:hypothetical protein